MRIACPNCASTYEVPDSLLAAGPRLLRCARCAHQFAVGTPATGQDDEPASPVPPPPVAQTLQPAAEELPLPPAARAPPPPPSPTPPGPPQFADEDRPPPTRGPDHHSPIDPIEPPHHRVALVLAWLLSLCAVGGAAYAAYLWREDIMRAWPPAARLFAALGLA